MTQYYLVLKDIKSKQETKTFAKLNQIISINDDNLILVGNKETLFPKPITDKEAMGATSINWDTGSSCRIYLNEAYKTKSKAELRADKVQEARNNVEKQRESMRQTELNLLRLEALTQALNDPALTREITHEVLTYPMMSKMIITINEGLGKAFEELIPQI
jgi:hypothetical protein